MDEKKIKRQIKRRAFTIMSKLIELQDLDRKVGGCVLPCSTEGFVQDLGNVVYAYDQ